MDSKQIEQDMEAYLQDYDQLLVDYENTANIEVQCEAHYKESKYQAYMKIAGDKMTVDMRKIIVDHDTMDEWEAHKLAEIAHNVVKEKIKVNGTRLDSLRTLSASNRQVV